MKQIKYDLTAKNLKLHCFLLMFLPVCIFGQGMTTVEELIYDMEGENEARPNGTNADWSYEPRLGYGNNCPSDWSAMTAWGQVFIARDGSPAVNVRIQIRNIRGLMLSRSTGEWEELQFSESVDGAAYVEDFGGDVSVPADTREEDDGGLSVKLLDGYNYHFWPSNGRATIDPGDINGMIGIFEARLVVDDPAEPDDRESASIVASGGGDYWRNLSVGWSSDWSNNGDFAIGKFKFVGTEWRAFSGHTLTEQHLQENPPPIIADTGLRFTGRKNDAARFERTPRVLVFLHPMGEILYPSVCIIDMKGRTLFGKGHNVPGPVIQIMPREIR
jgi:hypothetical protein